ERGSALSDHTPSFTSFIGGRSFAAEGKGEKRTRPRLSEDLQARELQEKRKGGFGVLVRLVDVEPVALVGNGDVGIWRLLVRLDRVHAKEVAHQELPVERLTGRVTGDGRQTPGHVLGRQLDSMAHVVERLKEGPGLQIDAGQTLSWIGRRKRVERILSKGESCHARPEPERSRDLSHFH